MAAIVAGLSGAASGTRHNRPGPLQWGAGHLEAEQDRWFLWFPVLFGVGIALFFALSFDPSLWLVFECLVVALVLTQVWREGVAALLITSSILAIASGFAVAKLRSEWVRAPVMRQQVKPLAVSGWIELVEPRPARGQRLTLRVSSIEGLEAGQTPQRVRIRTLSADPNLKPGDHVRLKATLSPPAGPALPGGFDFARQAWFQGLGGVGYARDPVERVAIERPMPWDLAWRAPIERLRQSIAARITAALPGETGAIATALITGERGGISDATNEAYRDSGLLHILSISGLHMVIMAGAVFVTVRCLLTLSPALTLRYPIKKWAATAAAIGAFGYLLISGASFPTVRSYLMISVMYLAVLLDRPAIALRTVALSAFAILIVFPESLIDAGFQMSYAAVTALVSAYEAIREREQRNATLRGADPGWLRQGVLFVSGILLSTLIAGLAVAPFAAFHFHKSQQFAMIANLIAIPICNLIVMPAALAALVAMPLGLESWPLWVMGSGIDAMTWCAYKVAALPGAVGRIPEIPVLAFGMIVCGGLWLALWRQRWRYGGVLFVLVGLLLAPFRGAPDLYVGRDGLVAVRGSDGWLSALSPRASSFDLARILEHDGDGRRLEDVAAGRAFRCDGVGCSTSVRGHIVAISRMPASLADDCEKARLIIALDLNLLGSPAIRCRTRTIIDKAALARAGAHAIQFRSDGEVPNGEPLAHIVTVADTRGSRPWAQASVAGTAAIRLPSGWQRNRGPTTAEQRTGGRSSDTSNQSPPSATPDEKTLDRPRSAPDPRSVPKTGRRQTRPEPDDDP